MSSYQNIDVVSIGDQDSDQMEYLLRGGYKDLDDKGFVDIDEVEELRLLNESRRNTVAGTVIMILVVISGLYLSSGSASSSSSSSSGTGAGSVTASPVWSTQEQSTSSAEFGQPLTLAALPASQWKPCSKYTDEEKANIDAYVAYWSGRLAKDAALTSHLDSAMASRGSSDVSAIKVKAFNSFGSRDACEYYSAGLSGPRNGNISSGNARLRSLSEKAPTNSSHPSHSFRRRLEDNILSPGSCVAHKVKKGKNTQFSCAWDWTRPVTIISTATFEFAIVPEADYRFFFDTSKCDVGSIVGGSVWMSLTIDTLQAQGSWTFDIWSHTDGDASKSEIGLAFEDTAFKLRTEMSNSHGCCFATWLFGIAPGFDIGVFPEDFSLYMGEVSLGMKKGC